MNVNTAEIDDLERLVKTAKLLWHHSYVFLHQHHGIDTEVPGWLRDCQADIERADAILRKPDRAGGADTENAAARAALTQIRGLEDGF